MKILVLAKQVPDVNKIKFDPLTGRIIRENVPLNMNAFDRRAVEEAVRIKERYGSEVEVASMGPPQASMILNEALRMGADRAFLITDRKFGGADTWATSYILSRFIVTRKPDLVLAGRYSLDGETSQVPPETATMLDMKFFSNISRIEFNDTGVEMEQEFEGGIRYVKTGLPLLISVSEKINRARKVDESAPDMTDRIVNIDSRTLNLDFDGSKGSLTVVEGTESISNSRNGKIIDEDQVVEMIFDHIGRRSDEGNAPKAEINKDFSNGSVLGIALGDPTVSMEIASKLNEIATAGKFRIVIAGNIEPGRLKGMTASHYIYLDGDDIFSIAGKINELVGKLKPEFVIFPSNSIGRDVAGMIAAWRTLGLTADCVDIRYENGKLIQFKPAFGGGIVARISSRTKPEMATVRPGMFRMALSDDEFSSETLKIEPSGKYTVERIEEVESRFMPVQKSAVVIGIGRGVKGRDKIQKVVEFCEKHGIAVGATRPVVDMKLMPRQTQIGITGVSISPDLYVAIGVAGMDNHMSGLRYARTIIAINNNPEAPIYHTADYVCNCDAGDFIEKISTHHQ
ncbi:MAG: FAD-binding protein [Candidatus Thermoplasmatota archaeon]|jgi:electron transfer flavoprotein alpha subunit|nr:FAD-binding protein [Candidatus Thermoplasmatota archaeon]MCL5790582.1 FAD-binding protein [Candidatus Thermoplasmatota archaeon]